MDKLKIGDFGGHTLWKLVCFLYTSVIEGFLMVFIFFSHFIYLLSSYAGFTTLEAFPSKLNMYQICSKDNSKFHLTLIIYNFNYCIWIILDFLDV